ncbi:hypothetical protein O181_038476 [Austropuccinia psidii MF-1]|uniref:Uncharacterized protein n=1 Tax=Austropuccinia psidii MF-1 TaxID=1389203 RepID=A0A9Q3HBN9_9BASI|nr:hypothetical protein [Austropuccinia psidii MF-1]
MEANIQSKQMDLDKEEARPSPDMASLLQERHLWRMPEFSLILQGPKNFDINSEPEIIHGNVSKAEPFPSGRHRNISVPVQNLVQSSHGRGVENIPKPFSGAYELLLKHQELSGSGEYHRTCSRRPEERAGNNPSFGEGRHSDINQLQISFRSVQRKAQRTSEETERSKNNQGKGRGKVNWNRPYPQG